MSNPFENESIDKIDQDQPLWYEPNLASNILTQKAYIDCKEQFNSVQEFNETFSRGSDSAKSFYMNGHEVDQQSVDSTEEWLSNKDARRAFDLKCIISHLSSRSNSAFEENDWPKVLFVGNLCPEMNENLLAELFSYYNVKRVVIFNDMTSTYPYAYLQFGDYECARCVRLKYDGQSIMGYQLKVFWVFEIESDYDLFFNKGFIVFVDGLSTDIETKDLMEAFESFGSISELSIATNYTTNRSKGFGFINFVHKMDAQNAINEMNGQLIQCSLIAENGFCFGPSSSYNLDPIYFQSTESNMTVICFGLKTRLCREMIIILFSSFGCIQDIYINEENVSALISYESKRSAALAIMTTHQMEWMGHSLNCWWAQEVQEKEEECTQQNCYVDCHKFSQFMANN